MREISVNKFLRLLIMFSFGLNLTAQAVPLTPGANINAKDFDGTPALHLAVASGNLQLIKEMVDTYGINLNGQDSKGNTVMHLAVKNGDMGMINLLLDPRDPLLDISEIMLNIKNDEGNTALHIATAKRGSVDIIKTLLSFQKEYVNIRDNNGNTALHIAASMGKSQSVKLLLAAGANKTIKNNHYLTPADLASRNHYQELANTLKINPTVLYDKPKSSLGKRILAWFSCRLGANAKVTP